MAYVLAVLLLLISSVAAGAQDQTSRVTGTIAASTGAVTFQTFRTGGGTISATGTWVGTLRLQCRVGTTDTLTTVALTPVGGGSAVTSFTANGMWAFFGGYTTCAVNSSTWTSGTATINALSTSAKLAPPATAGGGSGTVTSVTGTPNRIDVSGTLTDPIIDIAATYVGQTSITTLGPIVAGSWAATAIPFAFGGTGLTTAADDTTLVSSGAAWVAASLPNCTDTGGNHLNYTTATNAFSCGTSGSGGSTAFSALTGSTNTTAAMVVGTGASLGASGSGTIAATSAPLAGVSGLGSNVGTFLATPSSANLLAAITDETGSGLAVFNNGPTLIAPLLGTPASGVLTNVTGLPLTTGVTGTLPIANGGTNLTTATDDNVMVGNGTTWQSKAVPDCTDTSGNHLNYTASSNAFSCGTSSTGSVGGSGTANTIPKFTASTTLGNSLLTDDGTTATYTGTGGMSAPKLVSTVATGTAPLVVTSTTNVPNLYVARATLADTVTTNANLTGDVTSVGNAATLANIPTAVPAAGSIVHTNIAAPGSPAAGKVSTYSDSTDLRFHDKNASGVIGTTVVADAGAANNFLTAISAAGAVSKAQPAFSNLSGTATAAQGGTGQTTYTKGDLLTAPGGASLNKLGVGTDGQVLTADTASTNGVKWSAVSGTGTVTSIATTSPITGGTITTTGTIACATCVTSAAALTSTALVTGGGSQASQTPSAASTLDSSGNLALAGNLTVAGTVTTTGTAGPITVTAIAAPSTPASGKGAIYEDSTSKNLALKNDAGTVNHGIQSVSGAIADDGSITSSGTGGFCRTTSCAMTTPNLGTPSALVITNASGVATNINFDAENTGNILSLPVKRWLPAAGCNNATAGSVWDLPTTTPAVPTCVTGTNIQKGVLAFADTSGGFSAQITEELPSDWTTTGGLDIVLLWTTTATTGNAKWSVSTACTPTNAAATDDPAFNTANTVTTAVPGTASRVQESQILNLSVTGCTTAARALLHVKVFRDGNDGSDTCSCTTNLIGASLTFRRSI